ncbi:MAG: pyruvate ferredoxin oxidoreductase [Desulfobacteraceae bacterium]|nr:MAG: pyruvate ferredoxin oxidoreductase [Desulfobacteraceae bacterium]
MIEIRLHGRGGQGSVIASKILAVAAFAEGNWVQSFPKFGVERRGAPVEAFLRIARDKIFIRSEVTDPDFVVVLDPSLVEVIDFTTGLKENGSILINTPKTPQELDLSDRFKVSCVNASKIAADHRLGSVTSPIVNTAICGAFARSSGLVGIDAVCEAITQEVPIKPENNSKAARVAFESTLF